MIDRELTRGRGPPLGFFPLMMFAGGAEFYGAGALGGAKLCRSKMVAFESAHGGTDDLPITHADTPYHPPFPRQQQDNGCSRVRVGSTRD